MDDSRLTDFVTTFLKKKGFNEAETAFRAELQRKNNNSSNNNSIDVLNDPELSKFFRSFSESEDGPARYQDEYSKLRSWTYSSLDLYKHELLHVLYPVFIHCFMDLVAKKHIQEARTFFNSFREDHEMLHLRDLQKLEGVLTPSHLEEMEFAHSLRHSKVNIKICQYSYELLLQYLHKTQCTKMLGIINERINFEVSPGQPSSISDDAEIVTLIGSNQDAANKINQKEVHWGLLEDSLESRLEKTGGLLSDSEKAEGENKEGEVDENKKRSVEGGKQGTSMKKLKKDKAINATAKTSRPEANTVPVAPRVKSELALPVMPVEVEQSFLEDLRNRVQLSSVALPSVCFYTFINTHNGLNCASISHDGSLVAGGFSDSSLKVWDMAKLGQQTRSSVSQGENDTTAKEDTLGANGSKRSYTLFQGHSGPVYSASFSPLGDYILSCSADATIRLWSTKLNANLVCYKGHNYPVWDVQFSPLGHYFASCSHDRTARVWSIDRIQPLRIAAGHLSDVDCVRWHANSNYIATGSSDKTVRLWDVVSGDCVRIFVGHRSMILSLAMSPDGRYMASGDEDGAIMMWDLASGRCVTPLMGHTSCVWSLAFSCEGTLLASGSADSTVKLWDVTTSTKVPKTEEKSGNPNRLRSLKTLPTKSTPVYTVQVLLEFYFIFPFLFSSPEGVK
ncbi:transcription initiation factor TFIID subunit 5 isoform X2 [Pistacia vera]|uniref:transcription initiation factor TFIID subunit 5 isoform X2 n=1 Tax=Pistacia vera TaxID=55513 RepID=UPI0012637682|nr:transcription initiation factor TFIID subunit 5 isoform X2 [Pistacia vera]